MTKIYNFINSFWNIVCQQLLHTSNVIVVAVLLVVVVAELGILVVAV